MHESQLKCTCDAMHDDLQSFKQQKEMTINEREDENYDCLFLDPLKHNWINLVNQSSDYLVQILDLG